MASLYDFINNLNNSSQTTNSSTQQLFKSSYSSNPTYTAGNIFGEQPNSYGTYSGYAPFSSQYTSSGTYTAGNIYNSAYRTTTPAATSTAGGILPTSWNSMFTNPLYSGRIGMNYTTPMSTPLYYGRIGVNYTTPMSTPLYYGRIGVNYTTPMSTPLYYGRIGMNYAPPGTQIPTIQTTQAALDISNINQIVQNMAAFDSGSNMQITNPIQNSQNTSIMNLVAATN